MQGSGSLTRRDLDAYRQTQGGLIQHAFDARAKARSYRGFRVGATVLAYDAKRLASYRFYSGYNIKLTSDGQKTCAEQMAVLAALSAGYQRIIAIGVVGPNQPDGESGKITPTLQPCGGCRRFLSSLPGIVAPDTLIITAPPPLEGDDIPPESVHEYTLAEILEFHKT